MSEQAITSEHPASGWRFKLGVVLFLFSITLPLVGIPLAATLDLSAAMAASVAGTLLMVGEVLGLSAVAVMGKSGFAYIKNHVFGFLKQYGPPQEVSRIRYNIGLVMFGLPILFAWLSIYVADYIPGFSKNPLPYAIAGDLLLLISLFVLGGDFWDKVKALFVYSDRVKRSGSQ
jgi:hypothetical protein